MLDQITRPNQITLRTLAEQIAGGRGTPRYHAILLWLLDEAQAGRIKLAAESSNHLASTVTEETAAAASAYWAAKQDVLKALRNGTTAAEAATEGARMRDKYDHDQRQIAQQIEQESRNFELLYAFADNLFSRIHALDTRYQGEGGDRALVRDIASDLERDPSTAHLTAGRDLWVFLLMMEECYGARARARQADDKQEVPRGGGTKISKKRAHI